MQPKYQVFISSTFEDLKEERSQVIKATLELGHIPVGMEMFSAADEEQWKIISNYIESSDYYAVLIAHRYGSMTPEGISYTQKEYEYAVAKRIPVLGFIVDDSTTWPPEFVDKDTKTVTKLNTFKKLVRGKPVGRWESADQLHGKYSVSLVKQFASHPRRGWLPADSSAGQEVGECQ